MKGNFLSAITSAFAMIMGKNPNCTCESVTPVLLCDAII